MVKTTFFFLSFFVLGSLFGADEKSLPPLVRVDIGTTSVPQQGEIRLTLTSRFQSYNSEPSHPHDQYDDAVYSPKSAQFLKGGQKLYIQALEGFTTNIYNVNTMTRQKIIQHVFDESHQALFRGHTIFNYAYYKRKENFNIFKGKPVESALSHDGKFLWVTYYRRDYDKNAVSPSAVAIIDTTIDKIVRVMPTGPLPKMLAVSPDNRFLAITHWGDNTVALLNIEGDDVWSFRYEKLMVVEKRLPLNFDDEEKIDRDKECGYCLRGTVFSPDSRHLLVGRMKGGGIAVFDMEQKDYIGSVFGMKENIRHLVVQDKKLFLSSNRTGYVQKTSLKKFLKRKIKVGQKKVFYKSWKEVFLGGYGVRTLVTTSDGKYIFACINYNSQVVAIRSKDMKVVARIWVDSYPVGMDILNDQLLAVTSQGKGGQGGNSVMIFKIEYQKKKN